MTGGSLVARSQIHPSSVEALHRTQAGDATRPSVAMPLTQTTNWSMSPFKPVLGKSATRIAMPATKTATRATT